MEQKRTRHGCSRSRLYNIWRHMKRRCYDPGDKDYKYYGLRGITVCPEWLHDFLAFRSWALSHGYRDDLTIDRIDNDKGYYPDNCRWATMHEQCRNRRRRKAAPGAANAEGCKVDQNLPNPRSTTIITG